MRVTTAFNKMLAIVGASVAAVAFTPQGIVVSLRPRRAKHRCACGWKTWSIYDRSLRRWRHLDLGATRCFVEAEIVRIHCRRCGRVRTEEVPWARPGARHSRDFQDVVAWLAQRVDKTTITKLLRVSWEAVAKIVVDVVAGAIDDTRLDALYRIGIDEVSYRKGHRFEFQARGPELEDPTHQPPRLRAPFRRELINNTVGAVVAVVHHVHGLDRRRMSSM